MMIGDSLPLTSRKTFNAPKSVREVGPNVFTTIAGQTANLAESNLIGTRLTFSGAHLLYHIPYISRSGHRFHACCVLRLQRMQRRA